MELQISRIVRALLKNQNDVIRMSELFVIVVNWYFIQFEVIYKGEETFNCQMLIFKLDTIKTHIFACFKDVCAVVPE